MDGAILLFGIRVRSVGFLVGTIMVVIAAVSFSIAIAAFATTVTVAAAVVLVGVATFTLALTFARGLRCISASRGRRFPVAKGGLGASAALSALKPSPQAVNEVIDFLLASQEHEHATIWQTAVDLHHLCERVPDVVHEFRAATEVHSDGELTRRYLWISSLAAQRDGDASETVQPLALMWWRIP